MPTSALDLEQVQNTAINMAMTFGPKLLVASIFMIAGFYAGRWVGNITDRLFTSMNLDETVRLFLVRIVRVLVLVLFGIMALQNLGVELLPLIAGLGVAGAGIALAMQGVMANLAAGLTIIFTRPFRVGEYIAIAGVEGLVTTINLFSTTLDHADMSRVIIPNRKLVGEILHNYGQIRQLEVMVGVAYDTDIGKALATIDSVLQGNARILQEPSPRVQVACLADSSVTVAIRPWVAVPDYGPANGELNRAVLETFRDQGITIPFPQREVRLLNSAD